MGDQTLTKRCFFQMSQQEKPDDDHDDDDQTHDHDRHQKLQQPMFDINASVNYEVEYLPHHHSMNLKSLRKPSFHLNPSLLLDDTTVHDTMRRILFNSPITDEELESIVKIASSKAKSIINDLPLNDGHNVVIPIIMSLRVIWVQEYNLEVELAWERLLTNGSTVLSFTLPATEKSVRDLDKLVFDKGFCLEEQCAICLNQFNVGEEVTRMPCLHVYHEDCIVRWLKNSHVCPSCRFPMPVCRVVDGTFPFLKRQRFVPPQPQVCGGKIRKGARMSVAYYRVY